jgi:nucleoside-diphosphate-sugar epimerase/predicted dehydrogenase
MNSTINQNLLAPHPSYLILGGGRVTEEYYLPALRRLGLLGVTQVADLTDKSLTSLRQTFPEANYWCCDHRSALERMRESGLEGPARVVVTLPNALHVQASHQALEAGHHVLCEKPVSLKAAECKLLRDLSQQTGMAMRVAMSRRYLPNLLLTKQIVQSGELGAIKRVEIQDCGQFLWRPKTFSFFAQESGGVLADMGVHYLDYLDHILGPLTPLNYWDDAQGGVESSLKYQLSAGDVRISMQLSRLDGSANYLIIEGDRGQIRVNKACEDTVFLTPLGQPTRRVKIDYPFVDPAWPLNFSGSFTQMLADFEAVLGGESRPIADIAEAERVTGLIEWAYGKRFPGSLRLPQPDLATAPPRKIVVTGASGFIGGHLLDRLHGLSTLPIRTAVRSPASCANLCRYPVELCPTDLLDPEQTQRLVAGAQVVYHLAYGKEAGTGSEITVKGTRNLVEAAIAAGVEVVVVLSTMYVFGFPKTDKPVDESFPYRPYGGEYGQTKATMEKWLLDRAKSSGKTRIVVLNPTCVYGPRGGAYTTMPVNLAREGGFCWINEGQGYGNYTYVENLVDAMLAAATIPEAHGERFIINDGYATWRHMLEPLLAPLGVNVPSYSLQSLASLPRDGGPFRPQDLLLAILGCREVRDVAKRSALVRLMLNLGRQSGRISTGSPQVNDQGPEPKQYPPEWLGELYGPAQVIFSSAKAAQVLKWTPKFDLVAAQARTRDWLYHNGYYNSLDSAS